MALAKYKVLQSTTKDGVVYLPEMGKPIGIVADLESNTPAVAFLMLYSDWAVEFPEEALREAQVEALVHNAEVSKDGGEKGDPNAQ